MLLLFIFMQGGISRFSTHISYQQGCLSYGHSPVKEIALYGSDLYFGSTDPKSEYGTFSVLVRAFNDSDTNMQILEHYPLCTLDPADDNYVGSMIGDYKVYYNFDAESESERRINVSGLRPNKSSYVRIVMNSNVETYRMQNFLYCIYG